MTNETPYIRTDRAPVAGARHRFSAGLWTHRAHGTPDHLLLLTLAGRMAVRHAAGETVLPAGSVVLYPPGAEHDFGVAGDSWTVAWAHFVPREAWLPLLRWSRLPGGPAVVRPEPPVFDRAAAAMDRLRTHLGGNAVHRVDLAMAALEEALLEIDGAMAGRAPACHDPRIATALALLDRGHRDPPSTKALAARCGLSLSRFSSAFRRATGTTVTRYIERRRMEQARALLSMTPQTVASIADDLGYADPFYFTRRFTRHTGASPSAFRSRFGKSG